MRICGNCDYNDGCVYTSNPPKYRCTFTGDFHFGNEPCKVDLVPVVRCGECKYNYGNAEGREYNPNDIVCTYFDTDGMDASDYCSHGERKAAESG